MCLRRLFVTLCVALGWSIPMLRQGALSQSEPHDIHKLAAAVDDHYNHLQTLESQFTETYRGNGMDRSESGTLWLKKPRKMRWEYRSPREKLFLSDGKDAWFYVPGERQVRKEPFQKLEDLRSPLGFLLGKAKLEKELDGLSFAPDVTPLNAGDVVLRGVPKGLADRVSGVQLEIRPDSRIELIRIEEVDGAVTEYRLTEQKENVKVSDDRFRFSPPPGVETIEGGLGQ
jgi:outer membrane lipoprotein carrier protein